MRFDNQKILAAIVVMTFLLFPAAAFITGPLRIGLGLLFVIFSPGYTLVSALFPKRDDLGGIERVALSFGLSIAVVPLIGLVLNYTPWGIRLYPILISVTIFIIVASAVGWYRQMRLPEDDRLSITLRASLPNWADMNKLDRSLSIFLAVSIVMVIGCVGYVLAVPKQGEKFTEFYILGLDGRAEGYPEQVSAGETVGVIIGVVNHEHQPTSYRVKIMIGGIENSSISVGTLAHEEKWEERANFTPGVAGEKQKVEFILYQNDEDKPYFEDPLHLYIDVTSP